MPRPCAVSDKDQNHLRAAPARASSNKIPHAVKEMVLAALMAKGGQKYLEEQADKNPVAFMALLGKILPLQVSGVDGGPLVIRWEG